MKTTTKMPHGKCDEQRRSFLKLSGLLGLGAVGAALLPVDRAEAVLFGKSEYKVTRTRLAMGTYVAMTAIHPSRDQAEQAIGQAFEEIDRLTALLSRHDGKSPVAILNAEGKLASAPPEILEVVARSLYFHRQTNGAFDITVKPVVDLYKARFDANRQPTEAEMREAVKRVGSDQLRFAGGTIAFAREGMGITLDGIAKGFIVDRASELLGSKGIANHLINAGGDIVTRGAAAKGKAWTVAIQDPAKRREYPDVIHMTNGAIATSGSYEIFYDKERMFHHIVDGRTGHSPHYATSVTVQAATVMDADALATALCVMEPAAAVGFIEQHPGHACFLMRQDGGVLRSNSWATLS